MKLFFFNSREVYTGYSSAEAERVVQALKKTGILCKHKVSTRGLSVRGRGGFGLNQDYTTQHNVLVSDKDYDRAVYLAHQALHVQ